MSSLQAPPLGLYVHLPWCERKCPYCDFNSHERETLPESDYVRALLADLRLDLQSVPGRSIQSIFIGGGTPSLFSVGAIERLLDGIAGAASLADDIEVTMEANPGSAEAAKFTGLRAAGINRLSLGIQSFSDTRLQALGRVHNAEQARSAVDMARSAGFDNLNLDLMHGLPEQDSQLASDDLRTAIDLAPSHLSWYQLTIEPNTVFYSQPPTLPIEDDLADIQDLGEALLADAGYAQYEVSAYARDDSRCRHNLNYWHFGDYIGIGAGAHGKLTDTRTQEIVRYWKTRQPDAYLSTVAPRAGRKVLDVADLPGEFCLNALRLNDGFSLDAFTASTGLDSEHLRPQLDHELARGTLEQAGNVVRPTALGRRFLNEVIQNFL